MQTSARLSVIPQLLFSTIRASAKCNAYCEKQIFRPHRGGEIPVVDLDHQSITQQGGLLAIGDEGTNSDPGEKEECGIENTRDGQEGEDEG